MVCQSLLRQNKYFIGTAMRRAFFTSLKCTVVSVLCLVGYFYHYLAIQQSDEHSPYKVQQQQRIMANITVVQSVGNIFHRVDTFNAFLSSIRASELQDQLNRDWQMPTLSGLDVILGNRVDYMQLLSIYNSVKTIVLPLLINSSFPDVWSSNFFLRKYYGIRADDKLCSYLMLPDHGERYKQVECIGNVNDSMRPQSFYPMYDGGVRNCTSWLNNGVFYHAQCCTLFYMHIYRDAIVTNVGHVITGKLKLVLPSCKFRKYLSPSLKVDVTEIPLYDELFIITQYWGTGYFHRLVEVLPRISFCLSFLKRNPQIIILAPENRGRLAQMLHILGLNQSRLVRRMARAKIVYQPRTTPCGFANAPETQMLSQLYRDYIERNFAFQQRNRLILVRRSGSRRFIEQKNIESVLQLAARDYNLTYTLFRDNPSPSLKDTMIIFHSAVMIVGPSGAGLANVLFSQPGTFVIEGVCNPPHVNMCFLRLTHVLGHHWHGIMSRRGCTKVVDVSAAKIDDVVRSNLRLWKNHIF